MQQDVLGKSDGVTKQGYLMKGPEVGSDRMFSNIGSKSFKRRYCYLRYFKIHNSKFIIVKNCNIIV